MVNSGHHEQSSVLVERETIVVTEGVDKKSPEPVEKQAFIQSFLGTLKRLVEDITSLEVATYVTYGDQEGEITVEVGSKGYTAILQAYTKISLDADTVVLLPVKKENQDLTVRQDLYEIHKQHLEMAKQTRQEMLSTLLNALPSISHLL